MLRTLIVEDNRIFRELLKEILVGCFPSMEVEEAASGAAAVQKISEFAPDVVFMDIGLAEENGLQITRKLRAAGWTGIVIVLTNHDLDEYRKAAFACGANFFFTKSTITKKEIVSLMERIISNGGRSYAVKHGGLRKGLKAEAGGGVTTH